MADRFQNGSLRLAIEFVGGPRDGERLLGSFADGVLTEAANIYRHTEGAGIGKRFWCPCEYTINAVRTMEWDELERLEHQGYRFRGQVYEIFERRDVRGALVIGARHVGAAE